MRINKPQLFNGQYLASNDAILVKLFGPNGFTSGAQVFSPAEGATLLSSLIPWSEANIPASSIIDRIYGETIAVSAEDARSIITYVDESIAAATDDVITGKLPKLADDIAYISGAVDTIGLVKNDAATDGYAATYTFTNASGGVTEINIPKDQFLKDAAYVPSEEVLRFTFELSENGSDVDKVVDIPVGELVDEYSQGNGIAISDDVAGKNVISVVVDPTSENFLSVGADGLKLAGVQDAIDDAKAEAIDDAVAAAKTYTDEVSGLLETAYKAYADQAEADAVTSAVASAKAYTDEVSGLLETAYKAYADQAETDAVTSAKAYTDEVKASIEGTEAAVSGDLNLYGIKAYVNAKTAGIATDAALGELQATVTEIDGKVTALQTNKVNVTEKGIYTWTDFTVNPDGGAAVSGLYVSAEGETKFWNGEKFVATSEEVADTFTDASKDAIPTIKAVEDYVAGEVDSVKEYVEGEVAATVTAVNTKAVEMLETEVEFGTETNATVPGRVIAVYMSDGEQCYPTIKYADGVSTISADATVATYTVVYSKRIGQANGLLPDYEAAPAE